MENHKIIEKILEDQKKIWDSVSMDMEFTEQDLLDHNKKMKESYAQSIKQSEENERNST